MNYYVAHSERLAAIQERLGADCPVISWKGNDYKIIPGAAIRKKDLAPGGFQMNADFEFNALVVTFQGDDIQNVSDLHAAMLNTRIGYLGNVYYASAIHVYEGGQQIRVECMSETQNA